MNKKKFCKNHPQKTAHRKCYYCKEPICSECQHHFEKHLFCSEKCYYSWKISNLIDYLKAYKQLALFILIIVISDIVIILSLKNSDHSIKKSTELNKTISDTSQVIFPFKTDEIISGNEIVFRVKVPQNSVVALAKEGKFIKTVINDNSNTLEINSHLFSGQNIFNLYVIEKGKSPRLLDSISVNYFSRRTKFLEHPLYQMNTKKKLIALTLDGGSIDRGTLNILDTLKKYDMHCTIFLTGDFMRHFPHLVKRMVNDGYEIGNHSYNHPHLTQLEINGSTKTLDGVTYELLRRQLERADSVFQDVSGNHLAALWRAPYGEFNKEIIKWAALVGYKHVGWSSKCDTWDWVADTTSNIYRTKIEILARLLMVEDKYGLNGKIILMHLGTERQQEKPYEVLGRIIRELRKRGYRFVTISELLNSK